MSVARGAAEVLDEHTTLALESIDRMYLNAYVPVLQTGAGASYFFRARAGLEDVRIHDFRHSFASRALALGESLPTIARLLGHGQVSTTARYAHFARDAVKASASKVAASIAADIRPRGPGSNDVT